MRDVLKGVASQTGTPSHPLSRASAHIGLNGPS